VKRLLTALAIALTLTGVGGAAATAANRTSPTPVSVSWDRDHVATRVGNHFTLTSRIVNPSARSTGELLAHLNVASLTSDVYVDPEDWSSARTQTLDPMAAGSSQALNWPIQAVNAGSFDVYVVLLPDGPGSAGKGPLWVSPPVHVEVAGRQTLSAGGALPVVLAVPIMIGLAVAATRFRARRTS
jgi:hypothetical protein